jgi:hypothetical protein
MKKTILIILTLAAALNAGLAQNVDDALRYSQVFYNGTARFNSMGGAFTALGGDISSLSLNPAGLGLFRSSEISISPQLYNFNSLSNFNGSKNEDNLNNFSLGQAGIILNLKNNNVTSGLVSLNIGYSFSKTNYLDQSIRIKGTSKGSSLLDSWADLSTGIIDNWQDHNNGEPYIDSLLSNSGYAETFLGWWTWLLDTIPGTDKAFGTAYTNYGKYLAAYGKDMTRILSTNGYTGEHSISLGANYSNKLFIGATVGITKVSYESRLEHSEISDSTLASGFNQFDYSLYYKNWGTGYSLKLGIIYKPIEPLRLGLSIHSPTYFRLNEYANDNIVSDVEGKLDDTQKNDPMWYSYALTTPFRVNAGLAFQLRKLAVFSADYEFADYGMARFSETGDGYDYTEKNDEIKNSLRSANNLRLGAEFRIRRLYLRGGYGYYGRAYKKDDINADLNYHSLSGGVGFRDQNIYLDFGYTRMTNPNQYILYEFVNDADQLVSESSGINISRNIFTVSFGYKFGY